MTGPKIENVERIIQAPETRAVLERQLVATFKPADATPSVLNVEKFKAGNTVANNVTYFDDGQDGQTIGVLGDGFTTVVNDASKLVPNGGTHLLLTGKMYWFTRHNKVWYEDA